MDSENKSSSLNEDLQDSKSLEEELNTVKSKLLQEFDNITKSLSELESKIKENKTNLEQEPIKEQPEEQNCKVKLLPITYECCTLDYKELLIKTIVNFFEKILRFFTSIFSNLLQVLPLFFLFYRITSLITTIKPSIPIVV